MSHQSQATEAQTIGETILVFLDPWEITAHFLGKAIAVRSEAGAMLTVIDGSAAGSVATFAAGEGRAAVLEGFTLTNGSGRSPSGDGGGIFCLDASPTIVSNLICGNSAAGSGGGLWCGGAAQPAVTNNTLAGNSAAVEGGGIACANAAAPSIMNNIVWDNTAPSGAEIHDGTGALKIYFNDVRGGWTPGAGNINADPIFVDPGAGDFHLTFHSPCRSMAYNGAPGLSDTDFEGDPRIPPVGIPDMGADEFHPHLWYTGAAAPGSTIVIKVADYKLGGLVVLARGAGIQNPPRPTPYGDLYLAFPLQTFLLGTIPEDGVLRFSARVPQSWSGGEEKPFQAKIVNLLTNLMIVYVE